MELLAADGVEMDFSEPTPPPLPRFHALRTRVRHKYDLLVATAIRIYLWNVCEAYRVYIHDRFHKGASFSSDRTALAALLREAFVKEGVTDAGLPYPPVARSASKP